MKTSIAMRLQLTMLETGKLADLVILSANPSRVAPDTIKEGRTVYRAQRPWLAAVSL